MSDCIQKIRVSDIDFSDTRYCFTPETDLKKNLALSIAAFGLPSPVWVRPDNGKFILLSGFAQAKAFSENKGEIIEAHLTDPALSDADCLLKAVILQSFPEPLPHAMLISAISGLSQFFDAGYLSEHSAAIFNTVLSRPFIEELLSISKGPEQGLLLLLQNRITLKTLRYLYKCPDEKGRALFKLFSGITASASKQMEIAVRFAEICARDRISGSELLRQEKIRKTLDDADISSAQKAEVIRHELFVMRYPELSRTKQEVNRMIQSFKTGSRIKIDPSKDFEGTDYTITIKVKSAQDLKESVERLQNLSEQPDFNRIFLS